MLTVEPLSARLAPAAVLAAGGVVYSPFGPALAPFPGYAGPVYVAALPDLTADGAPEVLVGAGEGGGPRVQVRDGRTLALLRDALAFEPDFRGGVRVGADAARAYVGAGPGGGPVLAAFDFALAEVSRVYVGDPAARTGVAVAGVADPAAPLRAAPHPDRPGDPAGVDAALVAVPPPAAAALAGTPVLVFAGPAVTALPAFAALAGVPTGPAGDGARTYDAVAAAYARPAVYLAEGVGPGAVWHELGHALDDRLPAAARAAWRALHPLVRWPTAYEAGDPGEAFAETVRRWVAGAPQPDPRAAAFLVDLFAPA